ncbi:MAG: ornithine carbamoyltransferase [Bdellovibrionota bacterium]
MSLQGKSLLTLLEYSVSEIEYLLKLSHELKHEKKHEIFPQRLKHKNIALIFEKPSTRTRCSFIVAAHDEGAHAECFSKDDIHFGKKESLEDTARVLGRLFDGIMFRGFEQETVNKLVQYSGRPVWNALTNDHHPTQALADAMTLQEKFGSNLCGKKVVYLGDAANNVAHSLMIICAFLGMKCVLCAPESRQPNTGIFQQACNLAKETGAEIVVETNPQKAVLNADCLYTDVWVSMGEENNLDIQNRIELLRPYQVNAKLMYETQNSNCVFLHCLPANKGFEVTEEVFKSKHSLVFDEAENRMHTIKALMVKSLSATS